MIAGAPASSQPYSAFIGDRLIASGDLIEVVLQAKRDFDANGSQSLLIFDNVSSELVEVDLRGADDDVVARIRRTNQSVETGEPPREGPGRPKLGVVGREVTLLPRHWDWLDHQSGGASVTLRKLVEAAKRSTVGRDAFRNAQESTYKFMLAMAGDLPGFEEAARLLFSKQPGRLRKFQTLVKPWPADIRAHTLRLFRRSLDLEKGLGSPERAKLE